MMIDKPPTPMQLEIARERAEEAAELAAAERELEAAAEKAAQEQEKKAMMEPPDGNSKRDFPNSGVLFKADNKVDARDRDFRGTADFDCPACGKRSQWSLSAWIKTARNGGAKFMSLKFKLKDGAAPLAQSDTGAGTDNIPF